MTFEVPLKSSVSELDDVHYLVVALSIATEIWRNQGDEIDQLVLTLTLADPDTVFYPNLDISGSRVALVFRKGSLEWLVLKSPFKAVLYAVCLCGKGGLSPSVRATSLKERLRKNAQVRSPDIKNLERLHDIGPEHLKDKGLTKMVVFVHGLFSTDLGVFDRLIGKLEGDHELLLAGFPHNSLAHIEANGTELAQLIHNLLWSQGPTSAAPKLMVVFVCHSRGGLVTRSAMVQLHETAGPKLVERVAGCITFGTPHCGASLAEYPDEFLGMATVLMQLQGSAAFASLIDILCVYESSGRTIYGIQDLRTPEGGGDFLLDLTRRERAANRAFRPELDILAIGGRVPPTEPAIQLSRLLGTTDHDLVVPIDSSIPRFCPSDHRLETSCDHFHYFKADQEATLERAKEYIEQRFRIQLEAAERDA